MKSLKRTKFGLQILVLATLGMGLAAAMGSLSALELALNPEQAGALNATSHAKTLFFIALVAGTLGKLLCSENPEEVAQERINQSLAAEMGMWVTILVAALSPWFWFGVGGTIISYLMFARFLLQLSENVGLAKQKAYTSKVISLSGAAVFAYSLSGLHDALGLAASAGLCTAIIGFYTSILILLILHLPKYLEEVAEGYTDPTLNPKDRKIKKKKEQLTRGLGGLLGKSKSKGASQPEGTAPLGQELAKFPRELPALHAAVRKGNLEETLKRIAAGDKLSTIEGNISPLHMAAASGNVKVAEALLEAGAKVDQRCAHGLTPLYFAVQFGRVDMVAFLAGQGARVGNRNKQGLTPLHWICSVTHPKLKSSERLAMVRCLLGLGADHKVKCKSGLTPRGLAKHHNMLYVVRLFDRHFPRVTKRTRRILQPISATA